MVAPRIPRTNSRTLSGSNPQRKRRVPKSPLLLGPRILFIPLLLAFLAIVWNIVRVQRSLKTPYPIRKNDDAAATPWDYRWCDSSKSPCSYYLPIDLQDYLPPDPEEPLLEMLPDPMELNDLFELDESSDTANSKDKDGQLLLQPMTDDLDDHPDQTGYLFLNPSQKDYPPTPKILLEVRKNMSQFIIPKYVSAKMKGSDYYAILSRRGLGDTHIYNQDRAVLVDPFPGITNKQRLRTGAAIHNSFFMGIWDGHGVSGHIKADYTAKTLPKFLMEKLSKLKNKPHTDLQIEQAFKDSFWEAHRQGRSVHDGGCTSSVVARLGSKLWLANTGDSRCMLVQVEENGTVNLTHVTKQHKPDDPLERERITKTGCVVLDPIPFHDPSARVVASLEGPGMALAMSRSLGDYDLEHCGVIPEPTVTSVDLTSIMMSESVVLAVCVTDGMFDYVSLHEIANSVSVPFWKKKYESNKKVSHLESAVEDLIRIASDRWMANTTFIPYRDDISIAVRRIQ